MVRDVCAELFVVVIVLTARDLGCAEQVNLHDTLCTKCINGGINGTSDGLSVRPPSHLISGSNEKIAMKFGMRKSTSEVIGRI
jgi:hypothetical protein